MYDDIENLQQNSYWPSVSDLFMTLFIIALVLLGALYYVFLPTSQTDTKAVVEAVGGLEMKQILDPINRMRAELHTPLLEAKAAPGRIVKGLSETSDDVVTRLKALSGEGNLADLQMQIEKLKKELEDKQKKIGDMTGSLAKLTSEKQILETALNDKPPIIKISEDGKDGTKKFRFPLGSAMLDKAFKDALRDGGFKDLAFEITKRNKPGLIAVDTLEIIGHTDGKPVSRQGNVDTLLPSVLVGALTDFGKLTPGSNNDLGLLRALAIKDAWREFVSEMQDARAALENIEVRCYSAGQTVPEGITPGDPRLRNPITYQVENPGFRRIEIRLTKLR